MSIRLAYVVIVAIASSAFGQRSQFCELFSESPFQAVVDDGAGSAMDLSSRFVIVGAERTNLRFEGEHHGAAYLYERTGPTAWTQILPRLEAFDATSDDHFGRAVAIHGSTAVVASRSSVYVYDIAGDTWSLAVQLPQAGSVDLDGDTLVIGDSGRRQVSIYGRNAGGNNNWGWLDTLRSSGNSTEFGSVVAIDENRLAVGAPGDLAQGGYSGAAYVFERDVGGTNDWSEIKKIVASDGSASDRFGDALALRDDTLVVGAWLAGARGHAYVFDRNEGGPDNWGEVVNVKPTDADDDANFGRAVTVTNGVIAVGAPQNPLNEIPGVGSVHVYQSADGGWEEVTVLRPDDPQDHDFFGTTVVLADTLLACGSTDGFGTGPGGFSIVSPYALYGPAPGFAGEPNTFATVCNEPDEQTVFIYGLKPGTSVVPGCPELQADVSRIFVLGDATADATGVSSIDIMVPRGAQGTTFYFQAIRPGDCTKSELIPHRFSGRMHDETIGFGEAFRFSGDFELEVGSLWFGREGSAQAHAVNFGQTVYLYASITGKGETFIPFLNVTLDLDGAALVTSVVGDGLGEAVFSFDVGAHVPRIWYQAAEQGRVSNVVETTVGPYTSEMFFDGLTLSVPRLVGGSPGTARAKKATGFRTVSLYYSVSGRGATFIPDLDVTLELDNAQLLATAVASLSGEARFTFDVPDLGPVPIWLQAAESGRISNVAATRIY